MDMAKTYNPSEFEKDIYKDWEEKGYFKAKVDPNKLPFTIVIPPPNITGQLHMGHALDETLQDTLEPFGASGVRLYFSDAVRRDPNLSVFWRHS